LAALPSAARRRANELILAWNIPASSCLGCRERGRGVVMGIALPCAHNPHPALPVRKRPPSLSTAKPLVTVCQGPCSGAAPPCRRACPHLAALHCGDSRQPASRFTTHADERTPCRAKLRRTIPTVEGRRQRRPRKVRRWGGPRSRRSTASCRPGRGSVTTMLSADAVCGSGAGPARHCPSLLLRCEMCLDDGRQALVRDVGHDRRGLGER
jgi:hypothetical protein